MCDRSSSTSCRRSSCDASAWPQTASCRASTSPKSTNPGNARPGQAPAGASGKEPNRVQDQSGRHGQAADAARASCPPQPGTRIAGVGERWARLRRLLWQPPRPHGEQPRERVVGPLELFYDLAVVVLVAQAAHHLAGHLTWHGLGEFAAVFTLVWIAWANGSLHHELHGHDDARARSTFLLQILVLAAMGAFIPQAGGARGAAFAVAAGVLFAVLAVLWLLAARGDRPEYRRASRLFVTGTASCAVLLAGTALLPASDRVLAWGALDVAYLAGFGTILVTADPAAAAALKPARDYLR